MDMLPADQAVETLVHDYYKLVFHTIYGLTGQWEESQDLTQDTFHQALKGIDAARATSGALFQPKAWLLRIALNTVRMQQRRRALFRFIPFSLLQERKQRETGEQLESSAEALQEQAAPLQPPGYGAAGADDPAELVAEQDAVRRAMAKLPEPLRVCLLLSIVGGLSNSEIARLLDLQEAAVRQRLTRARKQFKQVYAYESDEEIAAPTTIHDNSDTYQTGKGDASHSATSDPSHRLTLRAFPATTWRCYV